MLTDEPVTETVQLQAGGTLSLQRFFDGTFRLAIDTGGEDGFALSCPLASQDIRGLREASGALVLASLLDVVR